MKSYTLSELESLCKQHQSNKVILIQSALHNLGKIPNLSFSLLPECFLEVLCAYCQTIVMPSFNYAFPQTRREDLRSQKSEVGILTEKFRLMAAFRSYHPMFSFCAWGDEAAAICPPKLELNPFGWDSVYARLWERDALMMFFGIDIRVCTFMVFIEALNGVRYRYFKPFYGELVGLNGEVMEAEFLHFCLPPTKELCVDFSTIQAQMIQKGIIQVERLGGGLVYSFLAREFFDFVSQRLKENPFILLSSPPKRYWGFCDGVDGVVGLVDS